METAEVYIPSAFVQVGPVLQRSILRLSTLTTVSKYYLTIFKKLKIKKLHNNNAVQNVSLKEFVNLAGRKI
jgi:hypothetical protein